MTRQLNHRNRPGTDVLQLVIFSDAISISATPTAAAIFRPPGPHAPKRAPPVVIVLIGRASVKEKVYAQLARKALERKTRKSTTQKEMRAVDKKALCVVTALDP